MVPWGEKHDVLFYHPQLPLSLSHTHTLTHTQRLHCEGGRKERRCNAHKYCEPNHGEENLPIKVLTFFFFIPAYMAMVLAPSIRLEICRKDCEDKNMILIYTFKQNNRKINSLTHFYRRSTFSVLFGSVRCGFCLFVWQSRLVFAPLLRV